MIAKLQQARDKPAGLEDKSKKSKAERIAFDLLEYLDQVDYNKYYESMGTPGARGGEKEKLFSDFSSKSIKAAQVMQAVSTAEAWFSTAVAEYVQVFLWHQMWLYTFLQKCPVVRCRK